jgi:CubicO group peptidase (beta-lactamase class C family)
MEARFVVLTFIFPLLSGCLSTLPEGPRGAPEAVGLDAAKLVAIHGDIEELVRQKKVAGAVVLVARHGKNAFLDAVGLADVEAGRPMELGTIFRICSMTKPMTSVAAMMLVEDGKISLDDPVSKFLPEWEDVKVAAPAGPVPAERPVTIRHLITHTSGLLYGLSNREPFSRLYQKSGVSDGLVETDGTAIENARKIATVPLAFQPGTRWEYGLSVDVLGAVIEAASGKSLEEFFEERIFRPLEMTDTYFRLPESKRARLAAAYRPVSGGLERLPEGPIVEGTSVYSTTYPLRSDSRFFSGGAGLVSTAADYARFCQMLLSGGEFRGRRLLRKETIAEMTRPQNGDLQLSTRNHGDAFGYGFGVVTEKAKDEGLGSPGTYSWGGFYFTYFWVDPKEDLIVVSMAQLQPWGEQIHWAELRKRVYGALKD